MEQGTHRIAERNAEESTEEEQPSPEEQSSQETAEESSEVQKDPWMRMATVIDQNIKVAPEQSCTKRGPTYKVDLVV